MRDAIDAALAQRPADFAAFLRLMEAAGFKAQRRGSSLSFLAPGQEKATRCRKKTLGDDYTPEAIQERIEGRRVVSSSRSKAPAKPARKVNLLIDIQSKLQAGKARMKYVNANTLLPAVLVEELQGYIQGGYIYVPVRQDQPKHWGELSGYREELEKRNREIIRSFKAGDSMEYLAEKYYLSVYAIRKIIYQ